LIDDVLDYSARRRSSARPSATISAKARSPCRSFWLPPRRRRGARVLGRTLEELDQQEDGGDLQRAIKLLEKNLSLQTPSSGPAITAPSPATRWEFSDSATKTAMIDIIDFCIDRAY